MISKQNLPFALAFLSLVFYILGLLAFFKSPLINNYLILLTNLSIIAGFVLNFVMIRDKNTFHYLGIIALIPVIASLLNNFGYENFLTKYANVSRIFLIISVLSFRREDTDDSSGKMKSIETHEFGKDDLATSSEISQTKKYGIKELALIVFFTLSALGYAFRIMKFWLAEFLLIFGFVGLAITVFIYIISMMKKQ
jgi:hypothetical protein